MILDKEGRNVHERLAMKAAEEGDMMMVGLHMARGERERVVDALEHTPRWRKITRYRLLEQHYKLVDDIGLLSHILEDQ